MNNLTQMFTVGWNDVGHGLVMAVLGAVLTAVYQYLSNNTLINWHAVLMAAALAGVSYLIKNFFSDSQGKFLGRI